LTTWSDGSRLLSWLPPHLILEIQWYLHQSAVWCHFILNIFVCTTDIWSLEKPSLELAILHPR